MKRSGTSEYWRQYYHDHKPRILARRKALYGHKHGGEPNRRCLICDVAFRASNGRKTCSATCGDVQRKKRKSASLRNYRRCHVEQFRKYERCRSPEAKAKRREYARKWRAQNRLYVSETQRSYRLKNADKLRQVNRERRQKMLAAYGALRELGLT